jgi:hypothetical protein
MNIVYFVKKKKIKLGCLHVVAKNHIPFKYFIKIVVMNCDQEGAETT